MIFKKLISVGKKLVSISIAVGKIRWGSFFRLYSKNAAIVVWMAPSYTKIYSDTFEADLLLIATLIEENKSFQVCYGRKIGKFYNKIIFMNSSIKYNVFDFFNYTDILHHITLSLESQGNKVFLTSEEIKYWENKAFMHQRFKELGVSEPLTRIFEDEELLKKSDLKFPFLIKEVHSCSAQGVHKISSREELDQLFKRPDFIQNNEHFIVQELLNMRRDLRVILVDNEIVLHYWRINQAKDWKPTSTGHGSSVDFVSFPEHWRQYIIDTFQKFKITTGAFDIAWQNDDLSTTPLFLEISPSYQPNPVVDLSGKSYSYGQYKKRFSLVNSYEKNFIEVLFMIKKKYVKACLEQVAAGSTKN